MRSRIFSRSLLAALACVLSFEASALTSVSGKIESLYFSGTGNYAVRVVLKGVADPCGNGGSVFAFIDTNINNPNPTPNANSNYNVFVSALLLAKAQNSTINMLVTPAANDSTRCHLVEFNIGS